MRGAVGRGYSIGLFGNADCKRTLLHVHDDYLCLAGERCRLWFVWTVASPGIDGDLLGFAIRHDGHQTLKSMAGSHGIVYRVVCGVWRYPCLLCGCLSTVREEIFASCLRCWQLITGSIYRLARYMPHVRKAREEDLKEDKISQQEYDRIESLEKNHIR